MTLDATLDDDLDPDSEDVPAIASRLPEEEGLRVPLPLLFITLMILVIFSVFDILEKSYEVNIATNRRIAKVVLEGALSRADGELNGLALELVSGLSVNKTELDDLAADGLDGYRIRDPRDLLTIFQDNLGAPLMVFKGGDALRGRQRDRFISSLSLQPGGPGGRFVSLGGQVFMLSLPHDLTGSGVNGADRLVVGLPADKVLVEELEHYKIFNSGSLKRLLDSAHEDGFKGLSGLIIELKGDEYGKFRFKVIAQIVTVLIAFIICVIIARRIDEKNDALRRSYKLLAEGKKAVAAERRIAMCDPVTGIANRKAFDEFLDDAVRDCAQRDEKFVLALLDLDDFKPINDSFGHLVGDEALRHVANTIEHSVRQTDLAARLGGDEFAVILKNVPNSGLAEELIDRILLKVSAPFEARGKTVEISISAGLSVYPDDAGTGEQIFENADRALYAAKGQGKNQLCTWPLSDDAVTGAGPGAGANTKGVAQMQGWISRFVKQFV